MLNMLRYPKRSLRSRLTLILLPLLLVAVPTAVLKPTAAYADPAPTSYADYIIQNVETAQCVDVPYYSYPSPNDPVHQYTCTAPPTADNQRWYLQPTRMASGHQLYWIRNTLGSQCLDPPGYGVPALSTGLDVYFCTSPSTSDNQEWWLRYLGSEPGRPLIPMYAIVNYVSGLCLDVWGYALDGSDRAPDLPLTLYTCYTVSGGQEDWDDHQWVFI
jgi:Ricin-type beta-trefoil lectin domain-like